MAMTMYNSLAALSTIHIVLLLVVVLLIFGGRKLPELARGLGKGLRIFKDEVHGVKSAVEDEPDAQTKAPLPDDKNKV